MKPLRTKRAFKEPLLKGARVDENRLAEILEIAAAEAGDPYSTGWYLGETVVPELVEEIRRLQDDKEEHDLWFHSK